MALKWHTPALSPAIPAEARPVGLSQEGSLRREPRRTEKSRLTPCIHRTCGETSVEISEESPKISAILLTGSLLLRKWPHGSTKRRRPCGYDQAGLQGED